MDRQGSRACAIINGDDWGYSAETTARILDCVEAGSVTAVSGMVFMANSQEAAEIGRAKGVDVGLHLNFSTPFSAASVPAALSRHQEAVAAFLLRSRLHRYMYRRNLARSFDYLVASQFDEFARLYGGEPRRVDGHHHLHLCANVILGRLLPDGLILRRNFCFAAGEKSVANRLARKCYDALLSRRYRMVEAFVTLAPLEPSSRLEGIFSRARREAVEIETHPNLVPEYRFLLGDRVRDAAERRCAG